MDYALALSETKNVPWTREGFDDDSNGWIIPRPVNAHTHFRAPHEDELEMFDLVVPFTAQTYAWATAMPNLGTRRIRTVSGAISYRQAILESGRQHNQNFDVTVPFFIEPANDLAVIEEGFNTGAWRAAKLYPKGGTHKSDFGVDFLKIHELWPLFALMEQLGMLLLIHGEVVRNELGKLIPDRKREILAIEVIESILASFPKLKIVFEHISSKRSVKALRRWQADGHPIEATIAPQYLLWTNADIFDDGISPGKYSIPILKDEEDRLAILNFMVNGGGMLGTDSAPHDLYKKSQPMCCPGGVFNEPVALSVYFHMFRVHGGDGWFEKFKEFACFKAARFYDLPGASDTDRLVIREKDRTLPELYKNGSVRLLPMFGGMIDPYTTEQFVI